MKKRMNSQVILILSIIGFIFTGLKYLEVHNRNKELQNAIDSTFKYQLSNVLNSFSVVVNDYTYRSMLSSVSNAASMSELTTYEKVNDELDVSLHHLYLSLREEKSKDHTLSRIEELREIFFTLVLDPTSKEATDKLNQINKETFFSNEG